MVKQVMLLQLDRLAQKGAEGQQARRQASVHASLSCKLGHFLQRAGQQHRLQAHPGLKLLLHLHATHTVHQSEGLQHIGICAN